MLRLFPYTTTEKMATGGSNTSSAGSSSTSSRHLWVGGLPEDMTEQDIKEYFSK